MSVSSRIMVQKLGRVVVVDFIDTAIMDTLQIKQIESELLDLADKQDQRYILLDFSKIKFLSSQTIGVMLTLHKTLTKKKGWLGICGLKQDLHKVFKLTRLDKVLNFYDSQDRALRAIGI